MGRTVHCNHRARRWTQVKPARVPTAMVVVLLAVLLLSTAGIARASDRPSAPGGFSWYEAENGVGTFLRPDGWHAKEESRNGTNALFISREYLGNNGRLLVGLSVNQFTEFSRRSSARPSAYAQSFIQGIMQNKETIRAGKVEGNKDTMHVARVAGMNGTVRTIIHYIAVGMDDEDEVFLLWFEAPESEWEQSYGFARSMLNYFILGS